MNKIAYFMFFDYHYSASVFIYSFLPRKYHIHDPLVYGSSYPALPHPWVKNILVFFKLEFIYYLKVFNSYNLYWFNLLKNFLQLGWFLLFFCFSYVFNLISYFFKFNLIYIYIFYFIINLRNIILYLIIFFPIRLNFYFLILGCLYFLFFGCFLSIVLFSSIFIIIRIFWKYIIGFSSNFINLIFFISGFIFFLPFYLVLYTIRFCLFLCIYFISFYFNLFWISLLFLFILKLDPNFFFDFWCYVINSILLDPFLDYFNYYILGFMLEFNFNWKSFLIDNIDLTSFYVKLGLVNIILN